MFYLIVREPLASKVSIPFSVSGISSTAKAAAKSLRSLANSMNEQEEIRIYFFCCERCAKDHVLWHA
jgi:hypothetical protein